jgi:hypothetical protein
MDLRNLLDASVWPGLDSSERREAAARVAAQREGLRVADVDDHMAFFELDGAVFALVPGARAELGFDGDLGERVGALAPGVIEQAHQRSGGVPIDMSEWQRVEMTAPRVVGVAPFLAERDPKITGDTYIPEEAWDDPGDLEPALRRGIRDALSGEGFRLPTSDEWEYMYSAGARTFFPWGDGPWGRNLRSEPWTCRFGLVFRGNPRSPPTPTSAAATTE